MRAVKFIARFLMAIAAVAVFSLMGAYYLLYDSMSEFKADLEIAHQRLRVELFNKGYLSKLTPDEVRYVYQKKCYRQCHGEAAMITAVLSPAGWFQVVERMRVKENVSITGREADLIINYLEETYPTTKSGMPYEVRKKVHDAVWRNDLGQSDIYTDVIYATDEYLKSIGADYLIDEYEISRYHVFIVSFSVHEGEVDLFDLDKIATLRSAGREIPSTPHWELRFQTADKHHFEAIVRFAKEGSSPIVGKDSGWFELILKNVGGESDRVFRWDLPIKYPAEVYNASET